MCYRQTHPEAISTFHHMHLKRHGCVLLAYYQGYSREELAARYGRPVNTIKTWLHRSLASLRACLDGARE